MSRRSQVRLRSTTYLLRSHGKDEATRQDVNGSQDNGHDKPPNRQTSVENLDRNDGQAKEGDEVDEVPPVRHFRVVAHELLVDVFGFIVDISEFSNDGFAMEEGSVHQNCGRQSEGDAVDCNVGDGHVERGVIVVGGGVESAVSSDDFVDVVLLAEAIEDFCAKHWQMRKEPDLDRDTRQSASSPPKHGTRQCLHSNNRAQV